jgi:hypothetical protein
MRERENDSCFFGFPIAVYHLGCPLISSLCFLLYPLASLFLPPRHFSCLTSSASASVASSSSTSTSTSTSTSASTSSIPLGTWTPGKQNGREVHEPCVATLCGGARRGPAHTLLGCAAGDGLLLLGSASQVHSPAADATPPANSRAASQRIPKPGGEAKTARLAQGGSSACAHRRPRDHRPTMA